MASTAYTGKGFWELTRGLSAYHREQQLNKEMWIIRRKCGMLSPEGRLAKQRYKNFQLRRKREFNIGMTGSFWKWSNAFSTRYPRRNRVWQSWDRGNYTKNVLEP